jgi:hypothetical protein
VPRALVQVLVLGQAQAALVLVLGQAQAALVLVPARVPREVNSRRYFQHLPAGHLMV